MFQLVSCLLSNSCTGPFDSNSLLLKSASLDSRPSNAMLSQNLLNLIESFNNDDHCRKNFLLVSFEISSEFLKDANKSFKGILGNVRFKQP